MRGELLQLLLLLLLLLLVWHFGDAVVMVPFSHGNDYGCFHCSCTCIIIVKYLLSCLKLLFFLALLFGSHLDLLAGWT